MKKHVLTTRAQAQALVEFALAATLIFFLLAAVVDLGLIYFTMQSLRVAAQEGATYGSYPIEKADGSIDLPYAQIALRIYGAAGDQGSGFANLHDLNANGQDDLNVDHLHDNVTDPNAYIYVENLKGTKPEALVPGNQCRGDQRGVDLQNGGLSSTFAQICWVRVTVRYDYRMLFPLAPALEDTVPLRVSHLMPVRSSFFTGKSTTSP